MGRHCKTHTPPGPINMMNDLATADKQWVCSGGPLNPVCRVQRTVHNLRLAHLSLSHRIHGLSGGGAPACSAGARCRALDCPAPAEVSIESDPVVEFGQSGKLLSAGETGFRRLRDSFAPEEVCIRIRAAATVAMLQSFRRGGQTTLSLVPAVRERLLGCGDDEVYPMLLQLLERARLAAIDDLHKSRSPRCRTCGSVATPHEPAGATASDLIAPPADQGDGAATLHHRGALLIRLSSPQDAEAVGGASWGFEPHQPYWSPHIDQHNVRDYDVSALLYLTTWGDDFSGGTFAFHDEAHDAALRPQAGQLLTFSSGAENPHSVGMVTSGVRFALAFCARQRRPKPKLGGSAPMSSPHLISSPYHPRSVTTRRRVHHRRISRGRAGASAAGAKRTARPLASRADALLRRRLHARPERPHTRGDARGAVGRLADGGGGRAHGSGPCL